MTRPSTPDVRTEQCATCGHSRGAHGPGKDCMCGQCMWYRPKISTRIHVKRCCNGCGRVLGDVTEAEMDAAMAGIDPPDVRDECGCPRTENGL